MKNVLFPYSFLAAVSGLILTSCGTFEYASSQTAETCCDRSEMLSGQLKVCELEVEKLKGDSTANATKLNNLAEEMKQTSEENALLKSKMEQFNSELRLLETGTALPATTHIARMKKLHEIVQLQDAKMNALQESVIRALSNSQRDDYSVFRQDGELHILFAEKLFFQAGRSTVTPAGKSVLRSLTETLSGAEDINITVLSFIDDQATPSRRTAVNWDLGNARALAVTRVVSRLYGLNPGMIACSGRARSGSARTSQWVHATEIVISPDDMQLRKVVQN